MEPVAEGLAWLKHLFPPQASRPRADSALAVPRDGVAALPTQDVGSMETDVTLADANALLSERQLGLRFVRDDGVDRHLVQLVDEATGEVLRQIPSEEAVRVARALRGLLLDGHA